MKSPLSLCSFVICLLIIFSLAATSTGLVQPAHAAPEYAAGRFVFSCTTVGFLISNGGVRVLEVTFDQIAGPLQTAILTGQNQPVVSSGGVSLWALKSNELQVHYDSNPDGTKVIVRSDFCQGRIRIPSFLFHCTGTGISVLNWNTEVIQMTFAQIAGPLYTAILTGQNQPVASTRGISVWALKSNELQVHYDRNPDRTKLISRSDICGVIPAQVTIGTSSSTTQATQTTTSTITGRTTYVVRAGDNLFRISLRFGRSMAAIASANGITNYNLIYVGQVLVIP